MVAQLKKNNKKFREFLKINEMCVKRKFKSILEEPVSRLPQYLQQIAEVYHEAERELGKEHPSTEALFAATKKIQEVTTEIAKKSKDEKARRLLGSLQKKVFNNMNRSYA